MQDDNADDDTYIAALRRALKREAIRARNTFWFEHEVMRLYREAGSPYGEGTSAAIRWYREQYKSGNQTGSE